MNMMIAEVNEGTEFDDMPADLQSAIVGAGIVWPESVMIGTKPVDGKQLIMIDSLVSKETLEDWIANGYTTMIEGEEVTTDLGVSWSILACESEPVDQSLLLKYFLHEISFDEDQNIVETPITDLTGKLQTWAGKSWKF